MVRMTLQTRLVLQVFAGDPTRDHYGMEIMRLTGLGPGTLYPILSRLEEGAGWLTSGWEDIDPVREGRRPRRYYTLTAKGAEQARQVLAAGQWPAPGLLPGPAGAGAS